MKQLEGMLDTYSVSRGETLQYKQGLYELLIDTSDFCPIALPNSTIDFSGSTYGPFDLPGLPIPTRKSIMKEIEELLAKTRAEKDKPQNFKATSPGNLETSYNLGQITGEPSLKPYGLTERHDFSGHDSLPPHLNQDIINEAARKIINSGTSKKSQDGYKGLGPAHSIKYDGEDK